MIVVLAIIGVLSAVILNTQNDFNRSLIITDTSYTVALSIRQAQTFGLSSRTYSPSSNAGYGVSFSSTTPGSYVLFADIGTTTGAAPAWCPTGTNGRPDAKPGNCRFDSGSNEVVQRFTFGRGFTVTQFCGHENSSTLRCSTDTAAGLLALDVAFIRPSTNAVITGTTAVTTLALTDATIKLSEPGGAFRYICISRVGSIAVSSTTCP
jgi:hypothetical protein